jgi:hypothetical protein
LKRQAIDLVVLDALADDLESMEQILHGLHHEPLSWQRAPDGSLYKREDVVTALLRLIRDGLVVGFRVETGGLVRMGAGVMPPGNLDDYWFGITPPGAMIHANWEPKDAVD